MRSGPTPGKYGNLSDLEPIDVSALYLLAEMDKATGARLNGKNVDGSFRASRDTRPEAKPHAARPVPKA